MSLHEQQHIRFAQNVSDIDDDPNAEGRNNLSGFVACYCDIPYEGAGAFQKACLTMTSEYTRTLVEHTFSKVNPLNHVKYFLGFLTTSQTISREKI